MPLLLGIVAVLAAGMVVVLLFRKEPTAGAPPVLFAVPDFALTERSGRTVTLADLKGKTWIASFVFTRCAGACPMMMSRMYGLQEEIRKLPQPDKVALVSITVDPEHDTPEVLRERARLVHADVRLWFWLTGAKPDIVRLAHDGFKLPLEDNPQDPALPIAHSQRFVLVDSAGYIRGYYDGLEEDSLKKLTSDLQRVLK